MNNSILAATTVAVCLGTMASGFAWAHHGFGGRYDLEGPVWIEGQVLEAYFGQPHAELTIQVPADVTLPSTPPDLATASGFLDATALVALDVEGGSTFIVELPPTEQYYSLGNRISVGDTVAIVAVRNCEPPYQLNGQWLRLADGEIVARSGAMSYMVEAC